MENKFLLMILEVDLVDLVGEVVEGVVGEVVGEVVEVVVEVEVVGEEEEEEEEECVEGLIGQKKPKRYLVEDFYNKNC